LRCEDGACKVRHRVANKRREDKLNLLHHIFRIFLRTSSCSHPTCLCTTDPQAGAGCLFVTWHCGLARIVNSAHGRVASLSMEGGTADWKTTSAGLPPCLAGRHSFGPARSMSITPSTPTCDCEGRTGDPFWFCGRENPMPCTPPAPGCRGPDANNPSTKSGCHLLVPLA